MRKMNGIPACMYFDWHKGIFAHVSGWRWRWIRCDDGSEWRHVALGLFIRTKRPPVMPAHTIERFAADIDALYRWTGCLSYNDSYVGEPDGEFKKRIRSLSKLLDQTRREHGLPQPMPSETQKQDHTNDR